MFLLALYQMDVTVQQYNYKNLPKDMQFTIDTFKAAEAPQRSKGRTIHLSEFLKSENTETLRNVSFLDKTILNVLMSPNN